MLDQLDLGVVWLSDRFGTIAAWLATVSVLIALVPAVALGVHYALTWWLEDDAPADGGLAAVREWVTEDGSHFDRDHWSCVLDSLTEHYEDLGRTPVHLEPGPDPWDDRRRFRVVAGGAKREVAQGEASVVVWDYFGSQVVRLDC